jgi:hypothetical protein
MSKCTSKSLAQTQRDALVEAFERRGRKTANIWLLTSPSTGKDVVLVGDLRMEHFFAAEGDPAVERVEYEPAPIAAGAATVTFDAVVDFLDGHRECRHVRRASLPEDAPEHATARVAAQRLGGRYVVVTTRDLDAQRQRIQNWQRALPALNRCAHRPIELVEFEVLARVPGGKPSTIGELCSALEQDPALLVAATVRLVRKRALKSDMDTKPWGRNTCLMRGEAA